MKMNNEIEKNYRTIAAISTPIGSGAISIVRMSGKNALKIAFKIFHAKNIDENTIVPRMLNLGDIVTDNLKEKCMMVYFKAPNSYTGEDLVEFQCHGGEYVTKLVLAKLLENGATLAENGEFTRLAFMNGKMSLDAVEGVIDIINSTSEAEIKSAYALMKGKLYKTIKSYQEKLTELLSELEVSLDYPEHDIEEVTLNEAKKVIDEVGQGINALVSTEKQGGFIKSGINVAIIGKTNVGKSSLLNALLGNERAIVTDIEGTTRDIISESINYKDIKINFIDTAGIRESDDKVESIGIEKSRQMLNECDIALFVVDGSQKISQEEIDLYNEVKKKNHIVVVNKQDIKIEQKYPFKEFIEISAKNNYKIEDIKQKIYDMLIDKNIQRNQLVITNLRQMEALKECQSKLVEVERAINTGFTDIATMEIKLLWKLLGKITGESENEEIISKIFAKFCLGK